MTQPALSLESVRVSFQRWGVSVPAVDGVTLEIQAGQWVAIIGHNGSGKSTLVRAVAGLQDLDSGQVKVSGKLLSKLSSSRRARSLFMVHQNPLLGTAPLLTLAENLRLARVGRGAQQSELSILEGLGLVNRAHQPTELLSGGERQLLALAIAKLRNPEILLLDEPFSALDPQREELCLATLSELSRQGVTIVQVTHQPERLRGFASRLIKLDHGKVTADNENWSST